MVSRRRLLSTTGLAGAVLATGAAAGAGTAHANEYWYGCAPPAYDHHGGKHPGGGVTHNSASTHGPCSRATRQGIPCGGITKYSSAGGSLGDTLNCPTTNTDFVSSNRGSAVPDFETYAVITRLCHSCAGLTFSSDHITEGNSSWPVP